MKDNEFIKNIFTELTVRYFEPHRHYHDLSRIAHCLKEFEFVRYLCQYSDAVEFALLFHDAVYDVTRRDNEKQSGEFAMSCANRLGLSLNSGFALMADGLIRCTTHKELPKNHDAQFVVDIDLSSLGAEWAVFKENTSKISREYCEGLNISQSEFNAGRAKFIEAMLPPNRSHIYSTDFFREKYETQARENLKRSLRELQTGVA